MRRLRWLAIAVAAPLLTACIDMEQTLRVEPDGSAVLQFTTSVTSSAIATARQYPQAAGLEFCAQPANPDVHGLSLTVEHFSRGEEQICVMRASGSLAAIAKVANDKLYLPPDPPQAYALDYRLDDLGGGVYRLAMTLTPPPELIALTGADDMTRAAQAMILGPMEGHAFTWAVEANGIVDSTGQISNDGRRASYSMPLADILARPQPSYSFVTTFRWR